MSAGSGGGGSGSGGGAASRRDAQSAPTPWARYLGARFEFTGPATELHDNERLTLRLAIYQDGSFRYDTQLYDGGQCYTLESMSGRLALPASPEAAHDFVLEVTFTTWQAGSWNGEDRGESSESKRFTVQCRGSDALFMDKKQLTRELAGDAPPKLPSKL
eukprot:jgi/Tetstr1/449208/TSEL_036415.t1